MSDGGGIKKMRQGMSYSIKEKIIIMNVFKYFRQEFPDLRVTEIVRRTSRATGCSDKSIFQFRKEESSIKGFKEPAKTKIRKNLNINSRDIKYDNNVRQTIRDIIYDLRWRNIVPSLNTILKRLSDRKDVPKFSLMTLRRLMIDMGYYYEKNGNKFTLVENPDTRFLNTSENIPKIEGCVNGQKNDGNPLETQHVIRLNDCKLITSHPPPPPPPPPLPPNQKLFHPQYIPAPAPLQPPQMFPHPMSLTDHSHSLWLQGHVYPKHDSSCQ